MKPGTNAALVLRFFLGSVFLYAGLVKIFVMKTSVFAGTLSGWPAPTVWAVLIIISEVTAGLFILLGLFTRLSSYLLASLMFACIVLTIIGDFEWGSTNYKLGFFFVALAGLKALAILGPGKWSLEIAAFGKEKFPLPWLK